MHHELLVQEIQSATRDVFSTMLGIETFIGDSPVETAGPGPAEGVAAFVGIAGPVSGMGSINCNAPLACQLAGAMLMVEFTSVNDDVLDAMAEISNMIVGNIKTNLEARFGTLGLSIPTVVYGRNFTTRAHGHQKWTIVPFQCGDHKFHVQMTLAETGRDSSHAANTIFPILVKAG